MRHKLIILLFLALNTEAYGLDMSQKDKRHHATASFFLTSGIYYYARSKKVDRLEAYLMAASATYAIGLMKEYQDPVFDKRDMDANSLGIGLALPVLFIDFK